MAVKKYKPVTPSLRGMTGHTFEEITIPYDVVKTLHASPVKAYKGKTDFMFVFAGRSEVEKMKPDFKLLAEMGGRGVIVTAPGVEVDFVSRFFAPQTGINEDPVTGSAHTTLTPYWAGVFGKKKLIARPELVTKQDNAEDRKSQIISHRPRSDLHP